MSFENVQPNEDKFQIAEHENPDWIIETWLAPGASGFHFGNHTLIIEPEGHRFYVVILMVKVVRSPTT